ncbi:hypothetical protein [Streptomyces sp. NPDC057676]|uniref:hypothetical protein n=1 Tax=Streptomyces sp. NPDC057676 TaxID=3346205 RepID=UPI0036B149F1
MPHQGTYPHDPYAQHPYAQSQGGQGQDMGQGAGYPGPPLAGGQSGDEVAGGYPQAQADPYAGSGYQGGYDPYGYGQPYPGAPEAGQAGQDDTTYGDGTIPGPRRDGSQA